MYREGSEVTHMFEFIRTVDSFFWSYIAFILIIILGFCLTIQAKFFQIRSFPSIVKTFFYFLGRAPTGERGVDPLTAFFASVGGMIGIGNVVGVVTAVQIGGPGALFWVWCAALIGAIVKYSEIFLGLKHRVKNDRGSYDGGPMYFLQYAFTQRYIPFFVAFLLCIYGVEIYQFSVVTHSLSTNFHINSYLVIATVLSLVLYASIGGVRRIGAICKRVMPFFMVLYVSMCLWIIFQERAFISGVLQDVLISAFKGHAPIGGFVGSTALLAIQHGTARASYSADIGIGYDSIIHSESNTVYPERQAKLAILGVFIDNFICTMSILVVLLTGVWKLSIPASQLVQTALSSYFPHMHIFMPLFIFIVGYSTMIAYFCVGIKCARFLYPKYGACIYMIYGAMALLLFSFFDQSDALVVMSIVQALLLITNLLGIFILRKRINFD